ncbi:MAG: glycosyltransferase family 2 protein, partial [Bacteroidota bacterium]
MKVSVITVCYNSAATIETAVQSVVEQSHPDVEYIVVDGASSDDTLKVLEPYRSRIDRLISEPDKGIYDAINKGIEAATGDVVGLLHSDDLLAHKDTVAHIVQAFDAPDVDAVYADLEYVDREQPDQVIRYWKSGEYEPGHFIKGWMPPHPTFYVRKRCYDQLGLYNLDFSISADYELMLRMIHKQGIQTRYLPEVTVRMRVGGKS